MSLRPAWSTYELQTNQGCAARSQKEKNERSHLVTQAVLQSQCRGGGDSRIPGVVASQSAQAELRV